jgi:FtsP/CotA-like multicopper oxidase with cupredoxin domain
MQSRWRVIAVAGAGVIAAVVLFVVLRSGGDSDSTTSTVATSQAPAKKAPPKEKPKPDAGAETIEFKNGAPVGGVREIEVSSGDEVGIRVTSNVPADVHVHGYELEGEATPGEPAAFDFRASAEGEFEIEAHEVTGGHEEEGVQIASLTVTP